jgi:amino acid adenylation domain-containing protein/non-ribosomal peptide synthase protein (TIGR01720 family)
MTDLFQQIADLSSEKRALLKLLLKEQGINLASIPITPVKREGSALPLSYAQQRLWFLDQLEPGSPLYNIPVAMRLAGALNVAALERSLNEIVRRHESLRTTFATQGDQPVQIIAPSLALPVSLADLCQLPASEREAEALRLAMEEAQRPFDLTRGPLIRARLLRLAGDDHVALLTLHHIVADGWSADILVREMTALYQAFSTGKACPATAGSAEGPLLPGLPLQYADFAAWQRAWLDGDVLESQLEYWKKQLGGELPALELPADRPRPAVQTYRGAHYSFTLPPDLPPKIKALARQEEATLFMAALAAFQTLLHRYTGQDDIYVGTPIANRTRAEIENIIGFFVNTLVLRGDLSGEPTFRELLRRARETALGAYAHQDVPFEMLVDALQPRRNLSRTPLFQVMFVLQNARRQKLELPGLTLSQLSSDTGAATFDLTLTLEDASEELRGVIEYNTDLFDEATIARMAGHFQVLLESAAANPDQPISTLPMLTGAERRQLLVEWNNTRADFPADLCIHHLFEAQAGRAPDAIAVRVKDEQLTYHELNQRANSLARHLQTLGVKPETPVGLCVERSLELVVGLLGILKAGGAYAPLDPAYPKERLAFMLDDSQAPILLTQSRLLEVLPAHSATTVCLDSDWPAIANSPISNFQSPAPISPENLAYIIYTSGSTGQPKGVMVAHRSVVNHNLAVMKAFDLRAGDRVLQFSTINFDAAVEEIFPTWASGACLVLRPEGLLPSAAELTRLVEAEQLTVLDLPTAYWQMWSSELAAVPPSLRLVAVGGEKASAESLAHWQAIAGPRVRWLNTYGPTEATIIATLYEAGGSPLAEVPIGKPIANLQAYVLDKHLQPVPIGVAGELCLGGVGLARGYLNRPELTAEKFIEVNSEQLSVNSVHRSLFTNSLTTRLYKTGDRARYRPDGNLEYLGRLDEQVKVRGFRVELGEIEAALRRHPGVRESAVQALGETSEKRLVAYIVPAGQPPASEALRAFLKEKLPDYMIPSAFLTLEALPLTPSGKVNRRALPVPDQTQPAANYVAPRAPNEELLANLWAQLLHVERVSRHDNFFELGGHSLLATQLMSRVRNTFQVELPVRALFESPTVAGLAGQIESAQRMVSPPLTPAPREGALPLSFAQQRLWVIDQLDPGSPLYNLPDVLRLKGALDTAALERSLNEIIRRHEILRTTFVAVDGQPKQAVTPEPALSLAVTDLRGKPDAEEVAKRLAAEEAAKPFDLARGPLLRARLLCLADDDHIAILIMHHIVADGWSMNVLTREVAALYESFSTGQPASLPEPTLQYADFAAWQRQWLQGETLDSQLAYWKQKLGGCPPVLELPTDRPRPAAQTSRGAHLVFALPLGLSQSLQRLSRHEGVTTFMTLLAAFQTLLYRYTGQPDICVGTPIANRNRAEVENIIGFFVNTLVMRSTLSGEVSFRRLLQQVRETALGAYTHQDVPFEMLVEALQPQRDPSHSPLFQVMFALQNPPAQTLELPGLTLSSLEVDSATAKFDLTLALEETPGGLRGAWEYNADLFEAATIERMAGHYQVLLEGIVADPDQSITTLPMLTEAEQRQLFVEWNDTTAEFPCDMCVPQLFEEQVERDPDAVAVTAGGQALTYLELNRRANQVAHYLRTLDVKPGALVGICVERSVNLVVGALGVLKAGGAYVPMDPAYPPERLAFMLEDSGAPVLLTQKKLAPRLPANTARVVCLDSDWPAIANSLISNSQSPTPISPANLAYVIYTSGSTGQPKGVQIEHRSLLNLVFWHQRAFAVSPADRATQIAGPGFDASVWELWPYLTAGASIHIPDDDTRASPSQLRDWLVSQAITIAFLPTPLAESVLALEWPKETALRTLLTGGDKLHVAPPPTLPFALINNYGPTEYTVVTTSGPVPPSASVDKAPSIGRAIANTQLYLLDSHLQPVPVGVPGELHIGGAGLARGYLNRPELTAEKFIEIRELENSPILRLRSGQFSQSPILYKTGDLARYLPNGEIEFLGRIDHQVKIRGFRVELGEIENVLRGHAAVQDAAAWVWEEAGNKRLAAYVVPAAAVSAADLRAFLQGKLPDHMIPSAFVMLDALPLTPNGKVDRKALPVPDWTPAERNYIAPRTPKEETLAAIWSQLLNLKQVGTGDNFFELGGDSILSIQVIARANQAGLTLTPRQLFEHPTIAGLAAVAGATQVIHAEQGLVAGEVPLTPIQRWFFEQEFAGQHHWNQSVLLEVRQPLDRAKLEAAIQQLLTHHDALRLRFEQNGTSILSGAAMQLAAQNGTSILSGAAMQLAAQSKDAANADGVAPLRQAQGAYLTSWQQVNAPASDDMPLEWVDVSAKPEAERAVIVEEISARLQASLNLSEGPLLRAAYFVLGGGCPDRLLLVIHHLAVDGVSWRILLEDLQAVYQGRSLPPKTTSFREWARRLNERALSPLVRDELGFWLAAANGAGRLPVDFPGGENTEASVQSVSAALTAEETRALLKDVPQAYHTEINDALLTALGQALTRWAGARAVLVELEGHGREEIAPDIDLSRTVGWFTAVYPVKLERQEGNPGEALKTVKEQLRRIPGRGLGYGLLRYLGGESTRQQLRALPQAEATFNYLGQMDGAASEFSPAPESRGAEHSPDCRRSHLIDITAVIAGGCLRLEWTYSANLHRQAAIQTAAEMFVAELRKLIAHCQSPEAGGHTPSDFKLAKKLDQRKLDKVLAKAGQVKKVTQ